MPLAVVVLVAVAARMERLPLPEAARLVKVTPAVQRILLVVQAVAVVVQAAQAAQVQEVTVELLATVSPTASLVPQRFMQQVVQDRDTPLKAQQVPLVELRLAQVRHPVVLTPEPVPVAQAAAVQRQRGQFLVSVAAVPSSSVTQHRLLLTQQIVPCNLREVPPAKSQ